MPPTTTDGLNPILGKRQLQDINRGLAAVAKALEQCDAAEGCGVNCDDRRADLEEIRTQFNAFKATYFPNEK